MFILIVVFIIYWFRHWIFITIFFYSFHIIIILIIIIIIYIFSYYNYCLTHSFNVITSVYVLICLSFVIIDLFNSDLVVPLLVLLYCVHPSSSTSVLQYSCTHLSECTPSFIFIIFIFRNILQYLHLYFNICFIYGNLISRDAIHLSRVFQGILSGQ